MGWILKGSHFGWLGAALFQETPYTCRKPPTWRWMRMVFVTHFWQNWHGCYVTTGLPTLFPFVSFWNHSRFSGPREACLAEDVFRSSRCSKAPSQDSFRLSRLFPLIPLLNCGACPTVTKQCKLCNLIRPLLCFIQCFCAAIGCPLRPQEPSKTPQTPKMPLELHEETDQFHIPTKQKWNDLSWRPKKSVVLRHCLLPLARILKCLPCFWTRGLHFSMGSLCHGLMYQLAMTVWHGPTPILLGILVIDDDCDDVSATDGCPAHIDKTW